jgi:two-component system NtrC family sensor kinase
MQQSHYILIAAAICLLVSIFSLLSYRLAFLRQRHLEQVNDDLQLEVARHEITEELLQETQDYLNGIINSMPSIMIGVTEAGIVTLWNSSAEKNLGFDAEDILGLPLFAIFPDLPANLSMIQQAIETNTAQSLKNVCRGEGQDAQYHNITVYPVMQDEFGGAVIRLDDVTSRVKLESLMIQNEKMLSLGELAAGMAHEINNPLSAILQGVQNVTRRTSSDLSANNKVADALGIEIGAIEEYFKQRGIPRFLAMIQDAGERAAKIVTNMLEFSRTNSQQHSLVNLNELVGHTLVLAKTTFDISIGMGGERIKVIQQLAPNLPEILCSGAEIQQVILNLLRNAGQALSTDPTTELGTGESEAESRVAPCIELETELQQTETGEQIVLFIRDNGPGMSPEVCQHVFEPFYTTKATEEGTGLGLSVSYFIITEHHKGNITVESALGKGTCFKIVLPIIKESIIKDLAKNERGVNIPLAQEAKLE